MKRIPIIAAILAVSCSNTAGTDALIPAQTVESCENCFNGRLIARSADGLYAIADAADSSLVTGFDYSELSFITDMLATGRQDSRWVLLDRDGFEIASSIDLGFLESESQTLYENYLDSSAASWDAVLDVYEQMKSSRSITRRKHFLDQIRQSLPSRGHRMTQEQKSRFGNIAGNRHR